MTVDLTGEEPHPGTVRRSERLTGGTIMKPERWRQIERVWDAALERSREERAAFIEEACSGDEDLRNEVAALLAAFDECEGFIEEPAIKHAALLLAWKKRPC